MCIRSRNGNKAKDLYKKYGGSPPAHEVTKKPRNFAQLSRDLLRHFVKIPRKNLRTENIDRQKFLNKVMR